MRARGSYQKWWPVGLVAVAILVLDQITKSVVDRALEPGEAWLTQGPIHIVHIRNTGSAFGLFPNQTLFLIVVSFVAIGFMLGYYRKAAEPSRLVALSFGLLLGGAVGNLIDRVRHSFVVDFIDFQVWPVFNVADASITIGLFILVGLFLLSQRAERVAALKAQAESESGPVSEEGQSKKEREGPSPVNKPSPGPPA